MSEYDDAVAYLRRQAEGMRNTPTYADLVRDQLHRATPPLNDYGRGREDGVKWGFLFALKAPLWRVLLSWWKVNHGN